MASRSRSSTFLVHHAKLFDPAAKILVGGEFGRKLGRNQIHGEPGTDDLNRGGKTAVNSKSIRVRRGARDDASVRERLRPSGANVPEFILTVLLLELTPGPNMAYLAALTLERGRRAGLLATAGVAAGLSVHAVVAALGLGVLISKAPLVYDVLRWTGVAYILFLAWEAWQSDDKERADLTGSASGRLFWRGFLSNMFNPKSIIFFVSVIPGFVRADWTESGPLLQIARLGAIYVAIATTMHAGIVLLAGQLRPFLMSGVRHQLVRRTLAVALVLVAAWLAWTTRRT